MDNMTFIELCKEIYLQQFGNKNVKYIDFTNEWTGDSFRLTLTNKTLKLFTVESVKIY